MAWSKEKTNAYQKEYMRKRREPEQLIKRIDGFIKKLEQLKKEVLINANK